MRTFLYSEKAKDLLYKIVEDWLYLVSADLEKITSPICRRYHVPDHSLKITSAIAASDFHVLEQLKAEDIFAGDALRGAAVLVEAIVSVLVALLCGGSGVALIAEGPVGLATGFIASILLLAVGHIMGKKAIDQTLMDANLPLFVRRAALSKPLPKLERTEISIPNPVKLLQNRERAEEAKEAIKNAPKGTNGVPALVFNQAPLELVLDAYAEQCGKTIIPAPDLPKVTITLKSLEGQTLRRRSTWARSRLRSARTELCWRGSRSRRSRTSSCRRYSTRRCERRAIRSS